MSWWWSSSSSSATSKPQNSPSIPQPPPPPPPPPQIQPPPPQDSDAEFHAAFPHLAPPTPSKPTTSPTQPPTLSQTTTPSPSDQTPDSDYPTRMSCTAAFDAAFYCSSLGGHFNDIYRYGELRSCSEHWRDWRFCMGLSIYSKARQEEMVAQHYREKEERIRGVANSEDVWDRRGPGERIERPFAKAEEEARRVEGA